MFRCEVVTYCFILNLIIWLKMSTLCHFDSYLWEYSTIAEPQQAASQNVSVVHMLSLGCHIRWRVCWRWNWSPRVSISCLIFTVKLDDISSPVSHLDFVFSKLKTTPSPLLQTCAFHLPLNVPSIWLCALFYKVKGVMLGGNWTCSSWWRRRASFPLSFIK